MPIVWCLFQLCEVISDLYAGADVTEHLDPTEKIMEFLTGSRSLRALKLKACLANKVKLPS